MADETTIVLGPEWDQELRESAIAVLREMGADAKGRDWAVAGSQELETLELTLDGEPLKLEAETYVGLTLTGSSQLLERIRIALERRRA